MPNPMCSCPKAFWTIFIILPIIVIFSRSLSLLYTTPKHHVSKRVIAEDNRPTPKPDNSNRTEADILILGYVRGGSTFLGELLGVRKGSFYLYEPLYGLSRLGYFKPGYHCNMMDTYCSDAKRDDMLALGLLKSIYSCDFRLLKDKVSLWSFAKGRGHFNWTHSLSDCNGKERDCFEKQALYCGKATSRVTKVVRVTVSLVSRMLDKYPKLKIVHLMRDPRAILHSRMSIWPVDTKNILESARGLCKKMKEDFVDTKRLSNSYPNRVRVVYFEDLALKPMEVTRDIFEFANYTFTKDDQIRLRHMTESNCTIAKKEQKWSLLKRNSSETARKWRTTIPSSVSLLTGIGCGEVLDMARYPVLKDKQDLLNTSIPLRNPSSLLNDYRSLHGYV